MISWSVLHDVQIGQRLLMNSNIPHLQPYPRFVKKSTIEVTFKQRIAGVVVGWWALKLGGCTNNLVVHVSKTSCGAWLMPAYTKSLCTFEVCEDKHCVCVPIWLLSVSVNTRVSATDRYVPKLANSHGGQTQEIRYPGQFCHNPQFISGKIQ